MTMTEHNKTECKACRGTGRQTPRPQEGVYHARTCETCDGYGYVVIPESAIIAKLLTIQAHQCVVCGNGIDSGSAVRYRMFPPDGGELKTALVCQECVL